MPSEAASAARAAWPAPTRVLHVITGLDLGGTESMLLKLLGRWRNERVRSAVLVLRSGGALQSAVEALDVPVLAAGLDRGPAAFAGASRAAAAARRWRPDVVQGWLVHGNLAALAAARAAGPRVPALWGVRAGLSDLENEPRGTRAALRASARLAGRAARIVYNSARSAAEHEAIGYPPERRVVVPNGFDVERFAPSEPARVALRRELGLPPDAPLVGMLARHHVQKDHATFLRAAARAAAASPELHFVLAGPGVEPGNAALRAALAASGVGDRVHLLGARSDAPAVLAALDVPTLCSRTEAFPNVLGEAMACGLAPVATDVGDVRALLADIGTVVPVGDATALAEGWLALLAMPAAARRALGARARARVVEHYSLERVAERHAQLLDEARR